MSFEEYYEKYLTFHTKPLTRYIHCLGNLATVMFIYYCFQGGGHYLWALLLSPFVIYLFAWPSHWWVEGNRPAAFKNPIMAKRADWRMMFDIMRGKL